MAGACQAKEEDGTIGFRKSKNTSLRRTTLASVESLTVPMVQEVVLLADFQCAGCQKRVADIISRMNGETESVEVSVMQKKVTVTCSYPSVREVPGRQIATYCCMVMRINVDCNGCCRKLRRIILNTKEIEMHSIDKQHRRVLVSGRFRASDVAIRIRKKMNRRVEILEIQELEAMNVNTELTPETTEGVFQLSADQVFKGHVC